MTIDAANTDLLDREFSFRDFDHEFNKALRLNTPQSILIPIHIIGDAKPISELLASGGAGEDDRDDVVIPLIRRAAFHDLSAQRLIQARNFFMDRIPDRSGHDERTDMPKRASMAGLVVFALVGNTDKFRDVLPIAMAPFKTETEASIRQGCADAQKVALRMNRLERNGYFDFQRGIRQYFEQSAGHYVHTAGRENDHIVDLAEGGLKILDAMDKGLPIPSPAVQKFMDGFKPL